MDIQMNVPKLRFLGFDDQWEKKKLGNLAEVSSGGTPSRTNPINWNGNISWVTTSLIDFNVITHSEEKITDAGLKNSSAKLFPKDTILMAMYGQGKTRGKVARLGIEASTNQACAAIIVNRKFLSSIFLFQNLSKRYEEIRDLSNQGGQENLSGGIIKGIEISFPSLPEQLKIASFLIKVDEKLTQLKKKKELLKGKLFLSLIWMLTHLKLLKDNIVKMEI
ncbi:restriction endonuclease subunit S [Dyadobacter sp. LHD-138]|uniref:restriction endonuclease subunit S n=1 Tax=Dyadobacter sp. LHD-138 TaxID=3071413 RepID=UPI0027E1BA65|nr:restriction endonuclease subunit S [Dyadobacter sp. LHD-138]MDQ6478863.1 restriction endonuclease subunit S [Dyadobacter sp. LHD-138]